MEPEDDQHPADGLIDTIVKTFNGDGFKQTLRDAWNAHFGTPAPSAHDQAVQDMNNQANAHKNDAANQSFIKPDVAAKIRAKASGK